MKNIKESIIDLIYTAIVKHKDKNAKVFMCTAPENRNSNRNKAARIPLDQPQCPVFKDNRCCGGCKLTTTCEHIVGCNCYGMAYGLMGGTVKRYYLTKDGLYAKGRINRKGKFDWTYWYNINKQLKK